MTVVLSPLPRQLFLNPSNGAPASGFLVFSYAAGTTTKQNTYTNSTGAVPNVNPVILDTLGEADVWLTAGLAYKFVFAYPTDTDPPTNPIWTVDNILASGGGQSAPSKTVNSNYTILVSDGTILVDASGGPVSITLPTAASANGLIFNIKKIDSSANAVTLVGIIDGDTNPTILFPEQNAEIQSNGTIFSNL
jgi:hypothetical protein